MYPHPPDCELALGIMPRKMINKIIILIMVF